MGVLRAVRFLPNGQYVASPILTVTSEWDSISQRDE